MTDPVAALADKLKSIAEEAAACRAAFAAAPDAKWAWHCHLEKLGGRLTELPENRIRYILTSKLQAEQASRLRLFRPVLDDVAMDPAWETYRAAVAAARKTYCAAVDAAWETYNAAVDPVWETYCAAEDAAWKTHRAAMDPVWETYNAAVDPVWETYNAAVDAAWKIHRAAVDPVWETYNAAVAAARKTYNAAVAAAHELECPDCPWDGQTIFPNPKLKGNA